MTNFIYEREDYVERLKETVRKHEACNYDDYITLNELLDHIEAQGKQLRELNKAIEKKNATIAKYEREKEDLRQRNCLLVKKVDELNNGIHDADDLSWKQKYDALRHGSEQAIAALQKKCQEYKHSENDATISAIETLSEANKKLEESNKRLMNRRDELIRQCNELYMENEELKKSKEESERIISAKNTRINLLEQKLKSARQAYKALQDGTSNLVENTYDGNKELKEKNKKLEKENKKFERMILDLGGTIDVYVEEFKKLKAENNDLLESKNYIEKRCREAEKALETEKKITADFEETLDTRNKALEKEQHVNKDLNVIINNKNELLDKYMTKYNNLERNYNEEVRMKEEFKSTCFVQKTAIANLNAGIKILKEQVTDHIRVNNVLRRKLESIDTLTDKIDDVIMSEE